MKYKTKNGLKYITLAEWHRESMKNPEFRREYEALGPKYDMIHAVLDARLKRGITQAEIARRAGTTQSAIARFESGASNPTLSFLTKVAAAVGAKIEVRVPRR